MCVEILVILVVKLFSVFIMIILFTRMDKIEVRY